MFGETFANTFPDAKILGFVDKEKKGDDIIRLEDIKSNSFDYMLVLSANYFDSIYADQKKVIPASKILKVEIINNVYHFLNRAQILVQKIKLIPTRILLHYLKICVRIVTFFKFRRKSVVFVCKNFAGNNLKALLITAARIGKPVIFLSNNQKQNNELSTLGVRTSKLYSFNGFGELAKANVVIQDQGDCIEPLQFLGKDQKNIQMWHGIPLKRLNQLVGMKYDWMISTSDFVNETSLGNVILAKNYSGLGYPRNDLLLKEHDELDLCLCDSKLYELAKESFGSDKKVIVYMPTHRESATSIGSATPPLLHLDLLSLNKFCSQNDIIFILKLHPFVMQFQENFAPPEGFSSVLFHNAVSDIYPLLKYTDLLITDYSSIYFDFLLLDRPIIFYNYDYDEYSSNMGGFVYDYYENTPGIKVSTQDHMQGAIVESLRGDAPFSNQRKEVLNRFHTYQDDQSGNRICELLGKLNNC